jgi:glycosyltransferase involved in cell wall biosynthesis
VIYADQRWIGEHGIGRFARRVLANLNFRPVRLTSHPAAPFDALRLAQTLSDLTRNDLFFSPGYNTPLFCAAPFVFTICDLTHIYCPESSSMLIRIYYATILRRACHRAATILTISEFTRKQIVEWSGVAPEKVVNVRCGVDPTYRQLGESYGLSFPYLLCVSNRKPHKNEFRVLEAFAKAALNPKMRLVFTGQPTRHLSCRIERLNLGSRVDFTGVVEEAKLPGLYRGAEALVFPSLYEGFGLPLLEAMACGTPVVTANVTAMPEVAGDAALLVDPTSVEQIACAMEQIVRDTALRHRLRTKGVERAAQFSWTSTAAKVREVLARSTIEGGAIEDHSGA